MQTTTTTAVENKGNVISSFFNSFWQKGNRIATILAILMTGVLIGVAYYGLHRPHLQMSIMRLAFTSLILGFYSFIFAFYSFIPIFCFVIFGIATFAFGIIYKIDIITMTGLGICIIALFAATGKYLWNRYRKYLPLFIIIALTVNSWSISSTLSKPDPNFDWFSRANGKIAGEEVIIPLGFMTLEDKYFPVAKLEPVEIPAKILIPSSEKSGWKKEEKFDGNLRVEFRPQNYGVRRVISEHGDYNVIHVEATSKVAALKAVEDEIRLQLNLNPEGYKVIVSGIGS